MGCLGWRMGRGAGDVSRGGRGGVLMLKFLGRTASLVPGDRAETYQRGGFPACVRDGAPLSSSTPLQTLLDASTGLDQRPSSYLQNPPTVKALMPRTATVQERPVVDTVLESLFSSITLKAQTSALRRTALAG